MFKRTMTKEINGVKVTITQAKSNYIWLVVLLILTIASAICAFTFPILSIPLGAMSLVFGLFAVVAFIGINTPPGV